MNTSVWTRYSTAPVLPVCAALLLVQACSHGAPACPFNDKEDRAPSAGCFVASEDGLLLVQGLNGKLSPPGGSSKPGESAQCTAFRETWEETGLRITPRELLQVFDTGFYLYNCELGSDSGEIGPPPKMEIRRAFFLSPDSFGEFTWRYEEQQELLRGMLLIEAPYRLID